MNKTTRRYNSVYTTYGVRNNIRSAWNLKQTMDGTYYHYNILLYPHSSESSPMIVYNIIMIIIIEPNRRIQITSVNDAHTITAAVILCYYLLYYCYYYYYYYYCYYYYALYRVSSWLFVYVQTFSVGLRNAHYNHLALLCFSITRLCLFFCDNITLGTSQKFFVFF